ncbi:hypothetical protein XENOCAPTIV_014728 [Xenoophorus captivus]|uniref:Secreted protein n=1 Tax=Xenoophorus captivus TaxID=1517983 RepID=A0ABV0QT62_9TELE
MGWLLALRPFLCAVPHLSGKSCVDHDMGRNETHPKISLTEFPHRRCTGLPGTSLTIHLDYCPLPRKSWSWVEKHMNQNVTSTAENDPWWSAFSTACKSL